MIPRQMKLPARRAFYYPPFSLGPYAALSLSLSLALYEPPLLFGSSKARVAFAMARLGVAVLLCAFAFPFLIAAARIAGRQGGATSQLCFGVVFFSWAGGFLNRSFFFCTGGVARVR